jgi:hypothetical protein
MKTAIEKIMLMPPYLDCPSCGGKLSYGVIGINDDHFLKKCSVCRKGAVFPLPVLHKKVIYLDQMVLSVIMKNLDPSRLGREKNPNYAFYEELFRKLDVLGKQMLIVCPYSPIHQQESKNIEQPALGNAKIDEKQFGCTFDKIRKLYTHLSYGTKFIRYETIRELQVLSALKNWIKGSKTVNHTGNPSEAINGKINVWLPRFYPSDDSKLQLEELAVLNERKADGDRNFEVVVKRWQSEKKNEFKDWFQQEVAGNSNVLLNEFRQYESHIKAMQSRLGGQRINYARLPAANLMMRILEALEANGWPGEGGMMKAKEFFASKEFRQVPIIRIGSALWAGTAKAVHTQWAQKVAKASTSVLEWYQEKKFPSANDVNFISAYLPYCDAMFIDNKCAEILKGKPANEKVSEGAKIYSLDTKEEFLKYLGQIETDAPPGHHAKVCEIYGEEWIAPSVEILKPLSKKPHGACVDVVL